MWQNSQNFSNSRWGSPGIDCAIMAQRRDLFCRNTALAVPLVVLGLVLLTGTVFVSNLVVANRMRVAALEDRQEYLEARVAVLQAQWNSLTTPGKIQLRAQRELGLILPAAPHLVLVQENPQEAAKDGVWNRFLAHFGGAAPLEAAADPLVRSGGNSMVFLEPLDPMDGTP